MVDNSCLTSVLHLSKKTRLSDQKSDWNEDLQPIKEPKTSRSEQCGTISLKVIDVVTLRFENLPIWLLALYPLKINQIYIPNYDSFSAILCHIERLKADPQIFHKFVTLIGRQRFVFGTQPTSCSVWLDLGTVTYLHDQTYALRKDRCVFITDTHR